MTAETLGLAVAVRAWLEARGDRLVYRHGGVDLEHKLTGKEATQRRNAGKKGRAGDWIVVDSYASLAVFADAHRIRA